MTPGRRLGLRLATAACAAAILGVSLIPRGAGIPLPGGGYDKLGHALAFAALAALLAGSLTGLGWGRGQILVVTLAITVGYGILTEGAQEFVPGRVASLGDVLADLVGAALGGSPVVFLTSRAETPPAEKTHGETASPVDE